MAEYLIDTEHVQLPPKVRYGVLYKELPILGGIQEPITGKIVTQNKPLYIIEQLIDPNSMDMIIAYEIKEKSNPPIKAFDQVKLTTKYKGSTPLGALANKIGLKKDRQTIKEKPPVFITPVVQGTDTFTRQYGLGFYERERDRYHANGVVTEGQGTGVFIGLDSVTWERTYVPAREIASEYLAMRDVWWELHG